MNFEELNDLMREAGINVCPICGTPYERYHTRQKTCGTAECKRLWKNQYLRERRERLIAEDPEAFRKDHTERQRKSREKKRELAAAHRNLDRVMDYWSGFAQSPAAIDDDGIYYGRRQAEKTLARVPKIDVDGFIKEVLKNDDIHDNDTQARSGRDCSRGQNVHYQEEPDDDRE